MQFFTRIPRNARSKSYKLSSTESGWELQNTALWDTHAPVVKAKLSASNPSKCQGKHKNRIGPIVWENK